MMYDKIAPDEPTKAPVIIKAVFSKVKPIPAAAQPEYESVSYTHLTLPTKRIV